MSLNLIVIVIKNLLFHVGAGWVLLSHSVWVSLLACSLFILFYLCCLIEPTAVVSKTELSNGNYVILGFFAALLFRGQLRAYVEIQSWSYNWWLSFVKSPKVFLTVSVVSLSYLEVTDLLKKEFCYVTFYVTYIIHKNHIIIVYNYVVLMDCVCCMKYNIRLS